MKRKSDIIFILVEGVIWISFLVLDILESPTVFLKYASIVICFLYAAFNRKIEFSLAFFFTLLADLFLLVYNHHYALGLFLFLIVQIIYCTILNHYDVPVKIGLRLLLPFLFIILLNILGISNLITNLSALYFSQLFISCLSSYRNKDLRLFSVGLSLFVLCDLSVGLHNIFIYSFPLAWLQWFWYLPSQVLIAYSSTRFSTKKITARTKNR